MNTKQSTVLISGASSQLGVFLIPRLLTAGFRVLAFSRKAGEDITPADEQLLWMHPESFGTGTAVDISGIHEEITMFISCGPLDVATEAINHCPHLQRVVVFSTTSVFSKTSSPDQSENRQIADILASETQLQALCSERDLALAIFRPTLIYGCGLDRNISLLAAWIRKLGWLPLAGRATGLRQPVHANDLARLAVNALQADQPVSLDSPACGGSTLTYRQMTELIFDALDKPRRILSVPSWLLGAGVSLLSLVPRWRKLNPQMVRRQNIDLVFDDSILKELLDYQPRPFGPSAGDFEVPLRHRKYYLHH